MRVGINLGTEYNLINSFVCQDKNKWYKINISTKPILFLNRFYII